MSRLLRLVVAVVLMLTLQPAAAHAHGGWWEWLESLSGPGPFRPVVGGKIDVGCRYDRSSTVEGTWVWLKPCFESDDTRRARLATAVKVFWSRTGETGNGLDYQAGAPANRRVSLFATELVFRGHVSNAFEVGPGIGFMSLSGDIMPKTKRVPYLVLADATLRPFALAPAWSHERAAQILGISWSAKYFLTKLEAADFGSTVDPFREDKEVVGSFSVFIDVLSVLQTLRAR